jgi:diguanylate cyclase (GGDEF)-like protein/PAS domain S-box-containing protein
MSAAEQDSRGSPLASVCQRYGRAGARVAPTVFGWRSARGRAALAGAVFVFLLVALVAVAVWRDHDMRDLHSSLERRFSVVAALDDARAQWFLGGAWITTSALVDDPAPLLELHRQATLAARENLDRARAGLIALGGEDEVAALDRLTQEMDQLAQTLDTAWVPSLGTDWNTRMERAQQLLPILEPVGQTMVTGLEQLTEGQQAKLEAERAAADRAADTTLTLFIAFGLIALLGGTTAMVMLILSVVRPLASLQRSVRAVASGDLAAKAKVSGPEEVASLARDFNEMVSERRRTEEALRQRTEVLAERAKELNCLYGLSDVAQKRDVSLVQMLQATTDLLPPAWQYPEVACARIVFEGQVFTTDNFRETRWRQASDIVVSGRPSGTVEVRYLDEKPECEEGPFLDAERRLINAVAERLGHMIERRQGEQALQESEARYKALFAGAPEGMLVADLQTKRFRYANPAVCRMFGYTEDEFLRMGVTDIHPKESLDYVLADFEAQARGEKLLSPDLPCQRKDGSLFYANISAIMVVLDGRKCNVGIFTDMTERRQMQEALRETDLRYRTLFDRSHDAIYMHDFEGRLLDANDAALRLLGYSRDDILKLSLADLLDESQLPTAVAAVDEIMETGTQAAPTTYKLRRKDGAFVEVETLAAAVHEEGRPVAIQGIARDVTERRRMEEALREQARRDPLTGVLNHGAIVAELRNLLSGHHDSDSHAIAMVDVDGLKAVNDTYGHQVGDAVLVTVAGALSRDGALVGRYGGDEFVAILPGADRQEAERYQAAVVEALANAGLTEPEMKATVPVVASIGLATYPAEAGRVEDLISLADTEMYAAKRQRPVGRVSAATMDPLDAARVASMLGEIVPLLTSPGELNDKLELVAHRLAIGAGYDGVHFEVLRHLSEVPAGQSAFARVPDKLVEAWNREQRQFEAHPLREIIERTRRPVILDDVQTDQRLTDTERKLLRAGGLRSALLVPMFWQDELLGHLAVASKREAAFGPSDAQFLMAVATQATAVVRMATLIEELKSTSDRLEEAHTETVMLLAASAEAHDRTTGRHLENVRAITEALARELSSSEEEAREMGLAAVLHDIGKVRVPDFILASVGRLTDEEWQLMKQHTAWGQEFLARRPGFELAATIARSHHERWDGGGYPDGLSGGAIPEAAAIVAVADAFDAITSDRPYRPRRSVTAAMREIMACSGGQFSPKVVKALVQLHRRKMLPRPDRYAVPEKTAA